MSGKSIFDKLWERHVVTGNEGEPQLMYVDQHYIHEVTSPQAFQGLRDAGRKVRRPDLTFGTTDHNVPTVDIFNIRDLISKNQIDTLAKNVEEFGIDAATHHRRLPKSKGATFFTCLFWTSTPQPRTLMRSVMISLLKIRA